MAKIISNIKLAKNYEPKEINNWAFEKYFPKNADSFKTLPSSPSTVHMGIGGSGLGPKLLASFLNKSQYHVIDHVDLDRIPQSCDSLVAISKSGTTAETMTALEHVLSQKNPPTKKYCVSDPERGKLFQLFNPHERFVMPEELGGRYSIFSAVGLLPLKLMGANPEEFLSFDRTAAKKLGTDLAAWILNQNRSQLVLWGYGENLSLLPFWFCQLWGESLGKQGKGITPIPTMGPRDQHSLLQLFMDGPDDKAYLFVGCSPGSSPSEKLKHAMLVGTRDALSQVGRPVLHLEIEPTLRDLGFFLYASMVATATVAEIWEINAFDQPGVELAKRLAREFMAQ